MDGQGWRHRSLTADPFVGQERAAMHTAALAHECQDCGAGIGADCTNSITGKPLSWRFPAHARRMRVARDANTYRTENDE